MDYSNFLLSTAAALQPTGQTARPGRQARKGALLVAFGTARQEAKAGLDGFGERVKDSFQDVEVRWAYTSGAVRSRLRADGVVVDSPESALAHMMDEGFTHVAVLSLHVIPGREYHDLFRNVMLFSRMVNGIERIAAARPLLSSHVDMKRVSEALLRAAPQGRGREDAVLFMGHGSKGHPSDAIYAAMNGLLQETDPTVFMATMDGYPKLDDVVPKLVARGVKRVFLLPFMAVAGTHAHSDLAGEKPQSWKSRLEGLGFACETILRGIIDHTDIADIWVDHLKEAASAL